MCISLRAIVLETNPHSQVVEKLGKLEDLDAKYGDGTAFAMKKKN